MNKYEKTAIVILVGGAIIPVILLGAHLLTKNYFFLIMLTLDIAIYPFIVIAIIESDDD
jgi:uncharacterized membrane protein